MTSILMFVTFFIALPVATFSVIFVIAMLLFGECSRRTNIILAAVTLMIVSPLILAMSQSGHAAPVSTPVHAQLPTDWLGATLSQWLGGRSNAIVYIVTHGTPDQLCLRCDAGQAISAATLGAWLDELNAERITVIIEACHSGSFIDELAAPGRVIATSTDTATKASASEFKAYFSDALFTCLFANPDLMACFDWAQQNVPNSQHPQIWIGWED